jgi:hypothetical protein
MSKSVELAACGSVSEKIENFVQVRLLETVVGKQSRGTTTRKKGGKTVGFALGKGVEATSRAPI